MSSQSYPATMYQLPDMRYIRAYETKGSDGNMSLHMEAVEDIYHASFFRKGANDGFRARVVERAYPNAKKLQVQITRTIVVQGWSK